MGWAEKGLIMAQGGLDEAAEAEAEALASASQKASEAALGPGADCCGLRSLS